MLINHFQAFDNISSALEEFYSGAMYIGGGRRTSIPGDPSHFWTELTALVQRTPHYEVHIGLRSIRVHIGGSSNVTSGTFLRNRLVASWEDGRWTTHRPRWNYPEGESPNWEAAIQDLCGIEIPTV